MQQYQTSVLLNGGASTVGAWAAAGTYSPRSLSSATIGSAIDLTGVADPAPADVYKTIVYDTSGKLNLNIPVPDGTYRVRMHFVEDFFTSSNQRLFDIKLMGTTLRTNYDIFASAGGRFKAKTEEYININVSGGTGLALELVNKTNVATLAGIDIALNTPQGVASPTVALDVSSDGTNWTPIAGASNLPVDRYGNASFNWTVPSDFAINNNYKIRATSVQSATVSDRSDAPFWIANSGAQYYVSPTGNNLNSGKTSDSPIRSLSGLLQSYNLDLGDVVNIASGNYRTYRNIAVENQDSGVTIRGSAVSPSVIDRGNVNATQYVFSLFNANGVTIDQLRWIGGEVGLIASNGSNSDNVSITNSQIYGNSYSGLWIGTTNDNWIVSGNKFYGIPAGPTGDDQRYGIFFNGGGVGHTIDSNEIYDQSDTGIYQPPSGTTISRNDIHGNRAGIAADYSLPAASPRLTIRDNKIRDNFEYGLYADSRGSLAMLVMNNEVYGHNGDNDAGMYIYGGTVASNNTVYGNYAGIWSVSGNPAFPSIVSGNRLYNNRLAAVTADTYVQVTGNYVYSNSIGVQTLTNFYGSVNSNLVYANTNRGFLIKNSGNTVGANFLNNTIYQTVGDAIRLDSSARNNRISNNILWVLAGYGLYVDNTSQVGFISDYNLFHQGADPNANVGFWNGAARDTITDWRTASSKDANSLEGNPGFVDIDGADNILGYVATPGGGLHGGQDDNFYRTKNSPAIDRGISWEAAVTDIEGFSRTDDPATNNAGGPLYVSSQVPSIVYAPASAGIAQNWKADNNAWSYSLPFAFSFYGTSYSSVWVSSNGFLQFGNNNNASDSANSTAGLSFAKRIAPLWDDLTTAGTDSDIYVDTSVANQVTFRWNGTAVADGGRVQFAATLASDGSIRFHYGAGNRNLTPTVGVSAGDGSAMTLVSYNGLSSLENVNSILLQPQAETGPQWAASVIGFSSQYTTTSYSAAQTLGAPNTNTYGDATTAWAPLTANAGQEFITVGYAVPLFADGVTVRETWGNGFVTRIDLIDTFDIVRTIWTGVDPSNIGTAVDFFIPFTKTTYAVKGVKVLIDTTKRTTWEEIDAIRLHGTAANTAGILPITATAQSSIGFYNYQQKGTAQNWKADDNSWTLTLPFAFPVYGTTYTTAYISSNGFIQFGTATGSGNFNNTTAELQQYVRLAALWDDLTTTGANDNIFIDNTVAGQTTVRWDATNKADGSDVQFSITMSSDGSYRYEYGPGNKNLTPTVGVSRGNSREFSLIPGYDGVSNLTNMPSVQFSIVAGITDIGAYEFRGSSNDVLPPTISASVPTPIQFGGVIATPVSEIRLTFQEEINPIDARSPSAYELRGAGTNMLFGDSDDVVYVLKPSYAPGQNSVVLSPSLVTGPLPGGTLPVGKYRVTAFAGIDSAIHDLAGNRLDGDANGVEGGNYVREFKVTANLAPTLSGANPFATIHNDDPDVTNLGSLISSLIGGRVTDTDGPGSGIAIRSTSSPLGAWQYSLDGIAFQPVAPKLAGGKILLLASDSDTRLRFKPNPGSVGTANDLVFSAWDGADELPEGSDVLIDLLAARSLSSEVASASINILPPNLTPTDIVLSSTQVFENVPIGTVVGTLSAVDPNSGDTHSFALVSGTGSTDNSSFEIVAGELRTKIGLDFESKQSYSVRIKVTDQDNSSFERAFTLVVMDLNEFALSTPQDTDSNVDGIAENAPVGSIVGITAHAVDLDGSNNAVTYSLLDSADGRFQIHPTTGVITLAQANLDFETVAMHTIIVRATSADGSTNQATFGIPVANVDEAVMLTTANASVAGDVLTTLTNTGTWSDPENGTATLSASHGTVVKNNDGTWSWSYTPSTKLVNELVTITASDGTNISSTSFALNALVAITNRQVYYKGSDYGTIGGVDAALDNNKSTLASNTSSNAADRTTTDANKINYSRGLNGMVIDVAGLVATSLSASDFTFRVAPAGASGVVNPSAWASAPVPTSIVVTPGSGSTPARIRIEWADNAIQNTWLQVIVKANANTGLSQQSAFYMGHAMAEITGGAPYRVTAADLSAVQSGISNTIVSVGDPRDINKDRRVTAADLSAVQSRISNTVLLNNITVPIAGSADEG
ncbi:MAG: cadherin domain-containing protein [Pirellula sp.]